MTVHIYGQHLWHDDATIIGSIDGAVQANAQTLDVMRNEFVQLGVITEELQHSLSKFRV